ncbi:hypothetical protein BDV96DRAFT_575663 [Lophiotrema nucula]|uniref:RapZ C-terminal domain-containing protein n=1 Tax=Lophiotrema nucula TaxID=690887 RepID=A0A6A5Z7Z7_9PLEO|nr:hypothetical protein BDV96DRAFT_575663 [Lophiotrema nucula]
MCFFPNSLFSRHHRHHHHHDHYHHNKHHHNRRREPRRMPTIYIVSYAVSRNVPNQIHARVHRHTRPNIPIVAEIQCMNWQPPADHLCRQYSGLSQIIRDEVLRLNPRALVRIREALNKATDHLQSGRTRSGDCVVLTCCVAGTHRSVTAAEVLKQELTQYEGVWEGLRVVVKHLDRQLRPGDPRRVRFA